jgi:excisionase family DNA binding protein
MEQLISVAQAAERAGVTRVTVYRWLEEGLLRGQKLGKVHVVQADDLERAASTVTPRRPRLGGKEKAPSVTS